MEPRKTILSVCGKGGVGKTAVTALLARVLKEAGAAPLLLIDADPAGGLVSAIGEKDAPTLAGARQKLIAAARGGREADKERLARDLDYLVMEALVERPGFALLAMGRTEEKGCFCPANILLREAIDIVAEPFAVVLIDAEAGLEQINRQVTRRVTAVLAVSDGSQRSADTVAHIAAMVGPGKVSVAANRVPDADGIVLPRDARLVGVVREDPDLRRFDRAGRSLWDLPADNAALEDVRTISRNLGLVPGG